MPQHELSLFKQNLAYAEGMVATATALAAQVTGAIKTDDLLRAALVQGVSAFDHFVHEEVRTRMILIRTGALPRAQGYDRFRVSLSSVDVAHTSPDHTWLEEEVRNQHGHLSFQHPDKVADAFRLVTDVQLWPEVGACLGKSADDIKRQLKLIVDRRNRIAHEADTEPTPPRSRYPIDRTMVLDSLRFLDEVAATLAGVC